MKLVTINSKLFTKKLLVRIESLKQTFSVRVDEIEASAGLLIECVHSIK